MGELKAAKLMKKALKAAPKGKLELEALKATVVAALVADGKSQKKAEAAFASKLELPCFKCKGSTVKLVKGEEGAETEAAPAAAAAAAPKRAAPPADESSKRAKASAPSGEISPFGRLGNVTTMTDAEAKVFYTDNIISVAGEGATDHRPCSSFVNAGFDAAVLRACKAFQKPTPIQAACWPIMMSGRDVIGVAETGSGKTLAFFLPAMMHCTLAGKPSTQGPQVLILSPTRELAMQTEVVCKAAGAEAGLLSVCIYGGVPKPPQKQALRDGARVVVATPGRLLDLQSEGAIDLTPATWLILDEADRMLDMGFEKDVRTIISLCSPKRRTVMFTATWPESIRQLAAEFLSKPVRVNVGSEDLAANKRVVQTVEVCENEDKERRLPALLKKYHTGNNRVLVFALYKKEAARVEATLRRQGHNVIAIHGDATQAARSAALEQFRNGSVPLLVATDVAARGLDIPDVEVVINYTFPLTIEDYIHRIGRTGRAGKSGISHTMFTSFDKAHAGALQNVLREAGQPVPDSLMKFGSSVKKKEHKMYGAFAAGGGEMKQATRIVF